MDHDEFRRNHETDIHIAFRSLQRKIAKGEVTQERYPFPTQATHPKTLSAVEMARGRKMFK